MKYLLSTIAQACSGELRGEDMLVEELLTDSRRSGGGASTLFVAIKGQRNDSHRYIGEILRRGVKAFMVERDDVVGPQGSYIVVEDSLVALQRLAAYHRSLMGGKVIAIVGSNGKTVVKEWIAQSYTGAGKLFTSPRSYNSQLGVALSILMCRGDEEIVLLEAGVSQRGEMERLEEMIKPEVVVVTSIGDAHQEGFSSIEEKVEEKMKMTRDAKTVIYHSAYAPLLGYFVRGDFGFALVDAAACDGGDFSDEISKRNSQIVEALLTEVGCSGYNLDSFTPVAMRLEVKEGLNDSVVVNDSYNSCVNSLSIALDMLNSVAAGRPTTLILSPILQSGVDPEELYAQLSKVIAASKVDRVIGVGGQMHRWLDCLYYTSTEELLSKIKREDYAQRAILLKGNRESRFERVSHALERRSHTTRLEINLDAMVANLNYVRGKLSPETKIIAMVKASGYGSGDYEVAKTLQDQGVDYLAVAFVDEGVTLREKGITAPIIVLNADDDSFEPMIQSRLEPEIYSLRSLGDFVAALAKNGERDYPIHIKLDTGMHRLGFGSEDLDALALSLASARESVKVASIFSHLSCADQDGGAEFTMAQIELFGSLSARLAEAIGYKPMLHIANSAAIEHYPAAQFDCCRAGISLYGFGVSGANLTPIATLKSRIVQIKRHKAGTAIGYGAAGVLQHESAVATVPIGYADGLNRELGCGRWSMLLHGEAAPIVGRVCMDSVMIDVSDIAQAQEGDEVVIFSQREGNDVEAMARVLSTIPYEVLTSISKRVKRVYLKE